MLCTARLSAVFCLLTCARVLAQGGPVAQDAKYEAAIDRAMLEFEAGRFVEARSSFEQAHGLRPSARTLRGLGVTALALKHYDAAREELQAALNDARRPLTEAQQTHVKQLLEWMQTALATLQLDFAPAGAGAFVDDQRIAQGVTWLAAGEHRLVVAARGFKLHDQAFRLLAREQLALEVRLEPMPEPAPDAALSSNTAHRNPPRDEGTALTQRWWFWTGIAVVVLAGAGVSFALLNQSQPDYERGGVGGVVRTLQGVR